jgi:glycosyltransferase involved in cell wall biosynthesis
LFRASHAFAFFDYFRVPYEIQIPGDDGCLRPSAAVGRLHVAGHDDLAARSLLWLRSDAGANGIGDCRLGRYRLGADTIVGRVAVNAVVPGLLQHLGRGWQRAEPVFGADGRPDAAIWRDLDGNVFLPFDPGEVMWHFWSEQYRAVGRPAFSALGRAAARRGYYLVRPLLPRAFQLNLRRAFSRVQGRSAFPAWPVEDTLHNLYQWLFGLVAELAGQPVPFLEPWPHGRSWALVLTHDVDTEAGYRDIGRLRSLERERGYSSSWNFVALRYRVGDDLVGDLHDAGFEVGVHGLRHDGRDLGSRRLMEKRLPAMRRYAQRWDAVGFRSPATQRAWELMPRLGFEYDSSYTDTDPYEPQPGGCCTYLPYHNAGMVELPITLPQDHTLFAVLQHRDADVWLRKARHIRERHGMVLVLTHPDYARDDPRITEGYRKLLDEFRGDGTVWHALPRDVAAWWRRRAASSLRHDGDGWIIEGPAATEGRVGLATACATGTDLSGARHAPRARDEGHALPGRSNGHILMVVENLPLGIDQRLRKQVGDLANHGFRVSVVTRKDPENASYRNLPGLTVLDYPAPAEPSSMYGYASEYGASFAWAALRCVALRLRGRIDVVQFCLPPDIYFPIGRVLSWLGATVVADYRDLMPELFAARYLHPRPAILSALRWLERRTVRVADHTICTNEYFRERLIEAGARPGQVTIVGNGPVLARVERAVADPALRGEHKFLCCWIGKMGRQDRVDLLIEAIRHVVHDLGRADCGFAILGDGECFGETRSQSVRLGLEPWVHFPGWLPEEEVFSYLASADLGLDTSLQADISPVKIMEYMAFGVPVVAFDVQQTRVMSEGAAALVPPANVQAFAQELMALLDDSERRAQLGEVGRIRVQSELAWERQSAVYVGLMRQLCRRSGPADDCVRSPAQADLPAMLTEKDVVARPAPPCQISKPASTSMR